MAAGDSPPDERRRLARRVPEATASEGAIDVVDELFPEDVVARIDPLGAAGRRDGFREPPRRTRGAAPDLEATVGGVVAEGDRVAVRVTLPGTRRGRFVGVDPGGRLDAVGLLRQLGVIEDPAR